MRVPADMMNSAATCLPRQRFSSRPARPNVDHTLPGTPISIADSSQCSLDAGFRYGYKTTDHQATYQPIRQHLQEWDQSLWIATTDIQKVFDSVEHCSIREAIRKHGIAECDVELLKKPQRGQTVQVRHRKPTIQTLEMNNTGRSAQLLAVQRDDHRA